MFLITMVSRRTDYFFLLPFLFLERFFTYLLCYFIFLSSLHFLYIIHLPEILQVQFKFKNTQDIIQGYLITKDMYHAELKAMDSFRMEFSAKIFCLFGARPKRQINTLRLIKNYQSQASV